MRPEDPIGLRLGLAQLNPLVGDLAGNADLIEQAYQRALTHNVAAVVTGELGLTGYPPEDLVLSAAFVAATGRALSDLAKRIGSVPLVVGYVEQTGDRTPNISGYPKLCNAAAVLQDGAIRSVYRKQRLPNYGVFDEARYFEPGDAPLVLTLAGTKVGVTICEDLWGSGGPVAAAADAGARVVLNLNASPYTLDKSAQRERWAAHHATSSQVWVVYVNQVGGQDEVVFDGGSFVMSPTGAVTARGARFATDLVIVELPPESPVPRAGLAAAPSSTEADVYQALVLGTRDYAAKNGFRRALIGISGGIDSALVAAVAADALGPAAVDGVGMPSPHSSPGSVNDGRELCRRLGVSWTELPIGEAMSAFTATLASSFAGTSPGVAEENLQSRIRGTLLMALSNKFGSILLATGNKSEYAVGYATLYGDMAGGFAVLKDVPKTLVYALARWRNRAEEVIPTEILNKPPSAELRPDQRDTDSLPPYDVLDPILEAYVEQHRSISEIAALGYDRRTVADIVALVDRAEYKRRQAPPGVKITARAFGKDRRLPITQAWSQS